MANLPDGVKTLGPFYISEKLKEKFKDACKIDSNIHMNDKIKELVVAYVKGIFPDYEEGDVK